jgi:hypothetical protein
MTKLLIIAGFVFAIIANVNGQISFGLNSGLNLTTLSDETLEREGWDSGVGYRIGGLSEIAFGKLGLRLEVDYSYVTIKGAFDDRINLHYISMPLTFFYKPIKQLKILVGPEVNLLVDQRGPNIPMSFGEEDFENFDYGAHVEIEFLMAKKLGVYLRNYFGLQYNGETMVLQTLTTTRLNKLNILGVGVCYYLK